MDQSLDNMNICVAGSWRRAETALSQICKLHREKDEDAVTKKVDFEANHQWIILDQFIGSVQWMVR